MADVVIGFSGTRYGMNDAQIVAVEGLLDTLQPVRVMHGCCIGADADFDRLCKERGIPRHGHPCTLANMRADCNCEKMESPIGPLQRNVVIVSKTDALIATPFEDANPGQGGTWHAIRQAKKFGKRVYIVKRDGTVEVIPEKE